ncbi:hypothetical protein EBX31_06145, partial [bacterium]|nr:hypothetical protein [bacterium]
SFEQAFISLQKSLKGSSLGIATFAPELLNLSKEQMKAGAAIDYLSQKYDGFARITAESFSMSLRRGALAFEDLKKAVGQVISEILNIGSGENFFVDAINKMTAAVKENREFLIQFGKAIIGTFQDIGLTISGIVNGIIASLKLLMVGFQGVVTGLKIGGSKFGLFDEESINKSKAATESWLKSVVDSTGKAKDAFSSMFKVDMAIEKRLPPAAKGEGPQGKARNLPEPVNQEAVKAYSDLVAKSKEMQVAIAQASGLERTAIDLEVEGQLLKLENLREELRLKGQLSDAADAEIAKQKQMTRDLGDKKKASTVSDSFGQAVATGREIAGQISGAFSEGTMGAVMGAVTAANAVADAVQGLIDFGPNLLNKIANIFSSLADLPIKLLEAVMNIDTALGKFIEKFPDAMVNLFSKLPDLAASILEKLGVLAPKLAEGVIRAVPPFVIALVKAAPRIAIAMAKGFIDGLKDLIGGLFDGSLFKMPKLLDPASAAKDIKQIARQLTEEASKVFAVLDFAEGGKRADTVVARVNEAAKKSKDLLDQAWRNVEIGTQRFLDSAGRFLQGIPAAFQVAWSGLEQAIGPFFSGIADLISSAGTGIVNGLVNALSGITSIFKNLGNAIWLGLQDGLSDLGGLIERIFSGAGSVLKNVFKLEGDWGGGRGQVEKLLGIDVPFVAFAQGGLVPGSAAVAGDSPLNDKILALLSPGEAVIPRSLMGDPKIKSLVQAVLSGDVSALNLAYGINDIGRSISTGVKDVGGAVANPFKDVLGSVWNSLSRAAQDAASTIQSVLEVGFDAIQQAANTLGRPIEQLIDEIMKRTAGGLRSLISLNAEQAIGFASGGLVPGVGSYDSVPALLTPGEFVLNKRAVDSVGLPQLRAINSGVAAAGGERQILVNQTIEVNIEAKETMDEAFIRQKLLPAIKKELKRASLDGQFVLSASGVRS